MLVTTHIHDPRPTYPLQVIGNRYLPEKAESQAEGKLTLVFTHATSLHKETWEPVIDRLFQESASTGTNVIREVWSIELPNHGESAILNADDLAKQFPEDWSGYLYPRAIHLFLSSKPGGVDLLSHELIGVGHSVGGNSLVLTQAEDLKTPFKSFLLLDATVGGHTPEKDQMNRILTTVAWTKPDVWMSRADALKDLSGRPGLRNWDKAVLELFIAKALAKHPAAKYPDPFTFRGVTLACSRKLEAACYRSDDHHVHANDILHSLYHDGFPIHLIFSKVDEFGAAKLKEKQLQGTNGGQPISVQWIEKGGHMFPQQQPGMTADAIWKAISGELSTGSRL